MWDILSSVTWTQWLLLLGVLVLSIRYAILAPFKQYPELPQKKPHWFLGNKSFGEKSMVESIVDFYREMKSHKFSLYWEGSQATLFITDIELVKKIMVTDFDHFMDLGFIPSKYKETVEKPFGLADAFPEEWKILKKLMTPAFSGPRIKKSSAAINRAGKLMIKDLKNSKGDFDLDTTIQKFAMTTIGAVAFGIEIDCYKDKDNEFMKKGRNMLQMWRFLLMDMFPGLMTFFKIKLLNPDSEKFFFNLAKKLVTQRKDSKEEHNDILASLIKSSEEQPGLMTEKMMLSTITQFFADGFFSFAEVFSSIIYLIAAHSDVQDKLQDEVDLVLENKDEVMEEDLRNMPYLDQVLSEGLRRMPIPNTSRYCTKEYKIPGSNFTIPKGMKVIIPIAGIQLDSEFWPNAEVFDPERFTSENKANHVPGTSLSFGLGPRQCIGYNLMKTEAKVMICHLVKNFRLVSSEELPKQFVYDKNGFTKMVGIEKIKIEKRE